MPDPPLAARLRSFLPGFPAQADAAPPGQPRRDQHHAENNSDQHHLDRTRQATAKLGRRLRADGHVMAASDITRPFGAFPIHASPSIPASQPSRTSRQAANNYYNLQLCSLGKISLVTQIFLAL